MSEKQKIPEKVSDLGCCPELRKQSVCDTLNIRYRLPFRPRVGDNIQRNIKVEVILHFQFERCTGPLVQGDLIYSTTLLPNEEVRLFTSDRHTRWSYDSESKLSYRHAATSVESFFVKSMAHAISNLTISETGESESTFHESWAEGGGGASFNIGFISIGGGGGGGSYDSKSTSSFSHSLSRHAESASMYVASGVRAKSAVSIGEVEQRKHAEGESEAHYESSSRKFHNPNKCRAITYLFYQINKVQRIRFRLVAIERRIDDPAAPTVATQRVPVDTTGQLSVVPQSITATHKNRLEMEQMARTSAFERRKAELAAAGPAAVHTMLATVPEPLDLQTRKAALEAVDDDLASAGLLDSTTGKPTEKFIKEISWEREELLPTPGVLIKGCLDDCVTCEPALQKEIELDLERKQLENQMLKKQIELLEKSQEYRCCPGDSEETEEQSGEEVNE